MATTTFYGLAACDACRRARKWLDGHGLDYTIHDVRSHGLPAELTVRWAGSVGWDALINRRSRTWRELGAAGQSRAKSEPAMLLADHPTLLKRPLLESGGDVAVGFDAERWSRCLGLAR
jgi:arsenate reductase